MSRQGPILVVSSDEPSSVAATLSETGMFPVIESNWPEAAHAAEQLQPPAVVVSGDAAPEFAALAAPHCRRSGQTERHRPDKGGYRAADRARRGLSRALGGAG